MKHRNERETRVVTLQTDNIFSPSPVDIGKNIMCARKQRGLSIKQLAEQVGVTASLLCQIEHGRANPSISTIKAISATIQEPLHHFFLPTMASAQELISRAGSRERLLVPVMNADGLADHYECELLTPCRQGALEMLRVKLPPHSTAHPASLSHDVDEAVLVEQGPVLLLLGSCSEKLGTQDSVCIPSHTPHSWINRGDQAVFLILSRSRQNF